MVHEHVVDARLGLVAARAHLVVRDRRQRHVVTVEADRGDVALVREHEALEHPAVGLRRVVVEVELVGAAADVAHSRDALALDAGRPIAEPLGEPAVPHVRRLDHVVVDADDDGDLRMGRSRSLAPGVVTMSCRSI